ncbi:MAG TPA: hypothetical protein VHH12_12330, partial [Mycobacterium sp.]|nr:hypothetical protein [Mycobacterium sp.]
TIQFHGTADRYTLNGAQAVALLYDTATTASANPAVSIMSVGTSGGQAVAYTFDLARSIVYTRQGNPAWAQQDRDGIFPVRSNDMFFGAAATDPQPDWIDLDKMHIPQADEHQRLLANTILEVSRDRKPLPRFWYLPNGLKAAVIMTGDDHGRGGTLARIEQYQTLSTPGCDPANWTPGCLRLTSYLYPNTPISDAQALTLINQGFELALHPTVSGGSECLDFTEASLQSVFSTQLAEFQVVWPSLPKPTTNRTHCVVWSDWTTHARVSLANGIRFDTNYYHFPASWVGNRIGFLYGTGMPMRFAEINGSMIDVYQAPTHFTDESGQQYPPAADAVLDLALGPQGYYGMFVANMHTDNPVSDDGNGILNSAVPRGVPIVTARQALEFLDGRNASRFSNLMWDGTTLSFTMAVGAGATGLQGMVPAQSTAGALTGMTRNGQPIPFTVQTIKGVSYGFFSGVAGQYQAVYNVDLIAPVISDVVAAPQADGTALITWTTDTPATSRVDYGTTPSSLSLTVSSAALQTS